MTEHYTAFGLNILSNRTIPGLVSMEKTNRPDLHITLGEDLFKGGTGPGRTLWYAVPLRGNEEDILLTTWILEGGSGYLFQYHDGAEFVVDRSGGRIQGTWPKNMTLEDAATYLLGPILGFALNLRGHVCLHASAVSVKGLALAFLGRGGTGKSTLAAAFANLGYRVITDDILMVLDRKNRVDIQPGYPQIRLWPESVKTLFGSETALPRMTPAHPTWDKCYFNLSQNRGMFQNKPLPLKGVYVGQLDMNCSTPEIHPMNLREGILALAANTYTLRKPKKKMLVREFNLLNKISRRIPIRSIRCSNRSSFDNITKLCHWILDDFLELHESESMAG